MNDGPTSPARGTVNPANASRAEDWIAAFRYVARHHDIRLSEQSARLAVQWDDNEDADASIRNLARRLGLRIAFDDGAALKLNSLLLPLVIEQSDGTIVLLLALAGDDVLIAPAATAAAERTIKLADLVRATRRVVHARPSSRLADERIDDYVRPHEPGWLRRILTADLRSYGYVLLASLISNMAALAGTIFSMQVYDRVVPAKSMPTLVVLFIGVIFALFLDFILRRMRMTIIDVLGKRADLRMSDVVFGHAMRVKARARPRSTGSFIAQLRELEQVREVLGSTTIAAVADIPFFLLFAVVLWYLAGPLVLVPLGALVLLVIPGLLIQPRLRVLATEAQRESSLRNAMLVEAVQGIEDIKMLQAEERFQRKWNHYTAVSAESRLRLRGLTNTLTAWTNKIQTGVYATIVFAGAPMVIAGDITTGVLVGASIMGSRMLAPMAHLTQVFSRLQQARIGAQSIDSIMRLPVDHPEGESRISLPATAGALSVRGARFGHGDQQARTVLSVDSLSIAPGERIAVLGHNGAGKSTLLQGLAGLLEPLQGEVLVDGLNLAQIDPADARREIGLLSSNARLFHGSIRENLTLGTPLASDADILRVLELVRADRLIRSLQSGLDYRLQEGGSGLSGGQVQSLLLARLFLREPSVLLLDEPSAAMDEATERHFVEYFGSWSKGRTLVIATHRTRVLDLVDRVILVENGRIAADRPKAAFLAGQRQARQPAPVRAPKAAGQ